MSDAGPLPMNDVASLEHALRGWLLQRRAALDEEVRRYPTPIAGCDLHLPALLEARAAVVRLLAVTEPAALAAGFVEVARDVDDIDAQRLRRLATGG